MKYTIGLDLGIASVGWAILEYRTSTKSHIIDCGVRIFDAAEVPKTGGSLAEARRLARGQRRTIRRRKYRLLKTKELLVSHGFVKNTAEIDTIFSAQNVGNSLYYDVYHLRSLALDSLLTSEQLVQVLINLVKHRGFKSNRKKDKMTPGEINTALQENKDRLKNYRTVGEMINKDQHFARKKRNSPDTYQIMVYRSDIESEAKLILGTQMKLGNQLITPEFIDEYLVRLTQQKSFDYKNNILEMIGNCQFEPDEKRAPKATLSALKFIAFSRMNNIRYTSDGVDYPLTPQQMAELWSLALTKTSINFSHIRKLVGDDSSIRFNYVDYNKTKKNISLNYLEAEKDTKIRELELKQYHEFKAACVNYVGEITWNNLVANVDLYDRLATVITYNKDDESMIKAINEVFEGIPNTIDYPTQQALIKGIIDEGLTFADNISLSLAALAKILPHLEEGNQYDKACGLARYHHSKKPTKRTGKLPSLKEVGLVDTITNPVVLRALSQMRKVVNALISKYGTPYQINVELARDVGKSSAKRKEIKKMQEERRDYSDSLKAEFKQTLGRDLKQSELERYKLWKQQDGKCLYSMNTIEIGELFNNGCQIDHIIPWSISYDDSLINKGLVRISHNQRKGNLIPFEYLGHDENLWHKLTEWWQSLNKSYYKLGFSYQKLKNLTIKKYDIEGFKAKNLNDTRFIAKQTTSYLTQYLSFADPNNKKPVRVLNGGVTAYLRYHWGLVPKDRALNDLHHAQDACIIAATTDYMVSLIARYNLHQNENNNKYLPQKYVYTDAETGLVFTRFPTPNEGFIEEVRSHVDKVFVSRMPRRKISGSVNDDMVRSAKYVDNPLPNYNNGKPFSTVRKPLADSKIKLDNNNEIVGICPTYKLHNLNLYNKIRDRLKDYGGDAVKAFAKGTPAFYAPDKLGHDSNVEVKNIKIIQTQNSGVRVRNGYGIANNGRMIRVDIFNKNGKNYIVPIYEVDVIKKQLPNKAIVAAKDEKDWILIDYTYQFLFSLYPNDFVIINSRKDEITGYVQGFDRSTGAISEIVKVDGSCPKPKLRPYIQSAIVKKYNVDVLGNRVLVKSERRLGFNLKNQCKD
jgi:CRISPR-associated endonuclease Csn1